MMAFLKFLISPAGRKVAAAVVVSIALFYAYREITNKAYEQGKQAGIHQAQRDAEDEQKKLWADAQKHIDEQFKAIAAQVDEVKQERSTFEQQRAAQQTQTTATIATYDTKKDDVVKQVADLNAQGVAAINEKLNQVVASLTPQQALTDLELVPTLQAEAVDLRKIIAQQQTSADQDRALSAKELATAQAQVSADKDEVNLVTNQRDFYQNAYNDLLKAGHVGFWHKVAHIITLGVVR